MVSTHPSNASKKVTQVVIDAQQKRRTLAQVQEDNACLQREKEDQEARTHKGIAKVAAVQDKLAIQEQNVSAARKPCPCPVGKAAAATITMDMAATGLKRGAAAKAAAEEVLDEVGDGSEANMQKKQKQVQKTTHHDAVEAVCGTAVPANADNNNNVTDGITVALSLCVSDSGPKGNTSTYIPCSSTTMLLLIEPTLFYWNLLNNLTSDLKSTYRGTVSVWAHRVQNPKTSSTLSHLPRSKNHPTSVSGIPGPTQLTKVTTFSSATAAPATPKSSEIGCDDAQVVGSLLDEDGEPEHLVAHALASVKKQPSSLYTVLGAMDVVDICNGSLTPPPPSQYQSAHSFSSSIEGDADMGDDKMESGDVIVVDSVKASPAAMGSKQVTSKTNVEVFDDVDVPPKKCVKKEMMDALEKKATATEKMSKEVLRVKYKNSDLPTGCQDGNAWCGLLIPTIAHAAGGDDVHPWLIEDDALILILTKAWKVIYAGKPMLIDHSIVPGDTVYYMAKQHLSEWCGGFGSAAIMMITSLMVADLLYEAEDSHISLWDVESDNKKEWSGMWQSMFVLQTFAAHLNYTQGCVPVPELNSKEPVLRSALSLAAAAVKRALHLLASKEMTFETKNTTSKGMKKPS
ncbi:uncharacterized protein EDB93DRAFT_1248603 [Suillus bovinus]|uniref:uncharacterized protein n=1 Tax=Suillus bovinus TaxID=48563 RepID=UPI001B877BD1|nr:uncharacterized protein EDB93DRAFT_1248603 [Suillus bovinus]KAG2153702.1 hypothetical protein EDB93DRAFT_1248603 [Suillus bovinus]